MPDCAGKRGKEGTRTERAEITAMARDRATHIGSDRVDERRPTDDRGVRRGSPTHSSPFKPVL